MKKIKAVALATSALVLSSVGLGAVGCAKPIGGVEIDGTKTQLTVKYYNGGNGQEWLDELIAGFEAAYANESFEENKKGVQILKDFEKKNLMANQVKDYGADVFLMEHVSYEDAIAVDALLDITDVVEGQAINLDGTVEAGRTIEQKMTDESLEYYARQVNGKKSYYGIPVFSAWHDMIYNIELFETNGYFFNAASDDYLTEFDTKYENEDVALTDYTYLQEFFTSDVEDLSKGPDGVADTDDDGLPATYAEFKMFLEWVSQLSMGSVKPFITNGNAHHYFATWANDIWANYEGKDNMLMNLKLSSDGKLVDDLVTFDRLESGEYVEKAVAPVEITEANAYLLQNQRGKLKSIEFLNMILSNSAFYEEDITASTMSHTDAQDYFINSHAQTGMQYAILMDGTWWNSEARLSFKNDSFSTARFGIMPTPKVDATHIGEAQTKIDGYHSTMFIKSSIAANKVDLAKKFVRYINSDAAMCTFSKHTQSMRNMKYEIDETTLSQMTEFGRQVYRSFTSDKFDVISWLPRSQAARNRTTYLEQKTYGWNTLDFGSDNPGDIILKKTNTEVEISMGAGTTAKYKEPFSVETYFMNLVNRWDEATWATTK